MGYGNTAKDGSGNMWHNLCDSLGRLIFSDPWSSYQIDDTTPDDSDKDFPVPANYEYELASVFVTLVSTGTSGDRQLVLELTDGTNVIAQVRAGAVQADSLTRYYMFGVDMPNMTSFIDTDYLSIPLPKGIILPATYTVRVYDKAAVDAAADDMTVRLLVRRRSV